MKKTKKDKETEKNQKTQIKPIDDEKLKEFKPVIPI